MRRVLPGLGAAVTGAGLAWLVQRWLPVVPLLTVAVLIGIVAALVPALRRLIDGPWAGGATVAGTGLLRLGVVLLGFQVGVSDIVGLGWRVFVAVVVVVLVTVTVTAWLGRRFGLPGDQSWLLAAGFSICGASAIGATAAGLRSRPQDTGPPLAMVTLCGTAAIAVLPLVRGPLGLDAADFGTWVGMSVHDVGQVVAAAQTAGPTALALAVVVKLTRVLLLAPVTAGITLLGRPDGVRSTTRVPVFVLGFLGAVVARSVLPLPSPVWDFLVHLQVAVLAVALVAIGASIRLRGPDRAGGSIVVVALLSWLLIGGLSWVAVQLV